MPCPYKIILGRETALPCPLSSELVQGNAVSLQCYLGRETAMPCPLLSGVKIGSAGVEPAWGEL